MVRSAVDCDVDADAPGGQPAARWGFWATIGLSAAVAVAYLLLQTGVAVVFILSELRNRPGASIEQIATELESNGLCLSVSTLVSGPCCVTLVVLFAWLRRGDRVADYLALHMPGIAVVGKWLLVLAGYMACCDALTYFLGRPIVPEFMTRAYETAHSTSLLLLALIVLAPVFEEVFFRGFLLPGLCGSRLGATGAVLLASLAWAGVHVQYDLFQMGMVFVAGVLLGAARVVTGSTALAIVLHGFQNVVASAELLVKAHWLS